ncbi:hypothetical protein R3Q06_34140 [Rhodococcus erythropolis]|uniref:hypothetical protein n=1 Tax=Rhodococcus erythropolis TaxID=1833 RepID=UPI002948C97F|nr:hypothetical protein [Rhodococcus erythropolis]MDV6278455.1 hypothetical protein [Rhodococcus erythropolis]
MVPFVVGITGIAALVVADNLPITCAAVLLIVSGAARLVAVSLRRRDLPEEAYTVRGVGPRPRILRAAWILTVIALGVLAVDAAVQRHWPWLVVAVGVWVSLLAEAPAMWRQPTRTVSDRKESITDDDVRAAGAGSSDFVDAVRLLRRRYPGLGVTRASQRVKDVVGD